MEDLFKEIAEKYNGSFTINEDSWYNGHGYLPLYVYDVSFSYKGWDFKIRHEFRSSEFSKPSAVDFGAFGDRHMFRVSATTTNSAFSGFEVTSLSILYKWITKNNKGFKVKTKDKKLKQQLENMPELKTIYEFTEIDGEFTPEFYGVNKKGTYTLTMRYATQQEQVGLLRSVVDFITKLPEIKT